MLPNKPRFTQNALNVQFHRHIVAFLWLVRTRQSLKSVHTTKVKIAVVQFSVCIFCLKCNSVIIRFSSLCKHVILFVYLSDMGFRSSFVCFLLAIGSFSSCIYQNCFYWSIFFSFLDIYLYSSNMIDCQYDVLYVEIICLILCIEGGQSQIHFVSICSVGYEHEFNHLSGNNNLHLQ